MWLRFSGPTSALLQATLHPTQNNAATPNCLHRLAYLHCALMIRATLTCSQAIGRLLGALRSQHIPDDLDEYEEDLAIVDATSNPHRFQCQYWS